MQTVHAPALNAQNLPWFNVRQPIDLKDLRGKLVILDFWTYCCINCIHVIPTLKRIEKRFPRSVVVIGVHSPKFPGEKLTVNLERAIDRHKIEHPVVHDTEFRIWKSYAIRAWPTLVFIGPDSYLLGTQPGEPDPKILEMSLVSLLEDLEKKGQLNGNARDFLQLQEPEDKTTLRYPGKITFSSSENEFALADTNHNQIVTAGYDGKITRRIGSGKPGMENGKLTVAEFNHPQGLCFHNGIIWVADTENHLIRKVDLAKEEVSSVAGTGEQGGVLKGRGVALNMALNSPWDLSLEGDQLYFANAGTHQIGTVDISRGIVANFAGTGAEAIQNGPRLQGAFAQPSGLSIGDGELFLADSETSAIRSVRLDVAGIITTYVGIGLFDFGDQDGSGKDALLQHPLGVHYSKGRVYIADSYNHKIKILDLKTQEVTTVAASVDLICDDFSCKSLWEPAGVFEMNNKLYVSDTNNHRILEMDLGTGKIKILIQ